jgi:hypothetical protein
MIRTATAPPPPARADAYERDLPQYSGRRIFAVWAAATVPMGILGWIVTPWLGNRTRGQLAQLDLA